MTCILCSSETRLIPTWNPAYHLRICSRCCLAVIDPVPQKAELAQYYSTEYVERTKCEKKSSQPIPKSEVSLVLSLIDRYHPYSRLVCEAGCSYGWLLLGLQEKGYNVKGYELSGPTAELARGKGLDVETGEVPAMGLEIYDVVILRHVLEHVPDCQDYMLRVERLIRPGGILIMAVPNWESLAANWFKQYWEWFIPPTHIWYFSKQSLTRLLKKTALRPLLTYSRRGDARPFPVEMVLSWFRKHSISRASKKAALSRSFVSLAPPTRLVPLGDDVKPILLQTANCLFWPIDEVIGMIGLGPELWLVARKL